MKYILIIISITVSNFISSQYNLLEKKSNVVKELSQNIILYHFDKIVKPKLIHDTYERDIIRSTYLSDSNTYNKFEFKLSDIKIPNHDNVLVYEFKNSMNEYSYHWVKVPLGKRYPLEDSMDIAVGHLSQSLPEISTGLFGVDTLYKYYYYISGFLYKDNLIDSYFSDYNDTKNLELVKKYFSIYYFNLKPKNILKKWDSYYFTTTLIDCKGEEINDIYKIKFKNKSHKIFIEEKKIHKAYRPKMSSFGCL